MTHRLTTAAACQIANVDPQRLNDYISRGDYDCAPQTMRGRSRVFNMDDLLGLRLFRSLMNDLGIPPKLAGEIACAVKDVAKEYPNENKIVFVQAELGSGCAFPFANSELLITKHFEGITVRREIVFHVEHERNLIDHAVSELQSVIGLTGNQ